MLGVLCLSAATEISSCLRTSLCGISARRLHPCTTSQKQLQKGSPPDRSRSACCGRQALCRNKTGIAAREAASAVGHILRRRHASSARCLCAGPASALIPAQRQLKGLICYRTRITACLTVSISAETMSPLSAFQPEACMKSSALVPDLKIYVET
jgi:hypothetical protein